MDNIEDRIDELLRKWSFDIARSKRHRDSFPKKSNNYRMLKIKHETEKIMRDQLVDYMADYSTNLISGNAGSNGGE